MIPWTSSRFCTLTWWRLLGALLMRFPFSENQNVKFFNGGCKNLSWPPTVSANQQQQYFWTDKKPISSKICIVPLQLAGFCFQINFPQISDTSPTLVIVPPYECDIHRYMYVSIVIFYLRHLFIYLDKIFNSRKIVLILFCTVWKLCIKFSWI